VSGAPHETVEVVEWERVAPRGSARAAWYVRREQGWVKAAEWTGAIVTRVDSGPGTVWERRIRFEVPLGTELLRVESRPRATQRKDPMAYLRGTAPRAPEARRRDVFVVERGGRLERRVSPRPPPAG
jgi:hypothetical protein